MLDVLIVLQSHTLGTERKDENFCKAPKLEISIRCFKSLINTINWAMKQKTSLPVNYRLIVVDDRSDKEFLDLVEYTKNTSLFPITLEHLQTPGIMQSILRTYQLGKEHGKDLVYFAQDDYLYYETCLWEMIDAYFQFKTISEHEVCIFPFDHPLRYDMLTNKPYFYKVVKGAKRHWRTAYHTACCFLVSHPTLIKEWDLFEAMGNHAYDELCEDETINCLFYDRNYLLFTPMPSVALHMGKWSDWDHLVDWKALWDKFPYEAKYQVPQDVKTVLNIGSGGISVTKSHFNNELEGYKEIMLDTDAKAKPDIVADMRNLHMLEANTIDCVYVSHALEHVPFHDVKTCLEEWYRVIKEGGEVRIMVPNLKELTQYLARGDLLGTVYDSDAGAIAPIDMIYGYRRFIASGNDFMMHKTGFTKESAKIILESLGMNMHLVEEHDINLLIRIVKPAQPTLQLF